MQFNREERHQWPEFAEKFKALGVIKGGWDEALENKLNLTDADSKKLNKLAWCYLTLSLEGDALQEMNMFANKNAYEVWQHLKAKYKPRDEKAYADLETKFVQCELEKPSENPEKWINKLIKISQRIESCYPSQKKSNVTMIAHILSRLPKEEKYYKNFVAMSRRFGYSKQSILEFKREVCDYWECNIQGMAQERMGEEQVQTVNVGKMEGRQDARWHEKQQEEGNYCYIDLFEEEFEECKLEAQQEETDLNREENEEAEKGEQELSEDLLKDGEDESIREEDAEDKKFPI